MTETANRSIEDLLQWAFPKGLVPLDVAERMDHIKALGQAFLLSLRTKTESARLTEYIIQRRDAGLNFVEIAQEIRAEWGIDISNDSCRDRYKRAKHSKRPHPKIVPEQPKTAPIETTIEDHNGEPTEMVTQAGPSEEPDTKQLQSDHKIAFRNHPVFGDHPANFYEAPIEAKSPEPGRNKYGRWADPISPETDAEIERMATAGMDMRTISSELAKQGIEMDYLRVRGRYSSIVRLRNKAAREAKNKATHEVTKEVENVVRGKTLVGTVSDEVAPYPSSEYESLREETDRLKAEGKSLPEIACHLAATAEKGSQQVDDPEKKAAFMEQARIDTRIITLHQQARMNPDEIAEKLQLPVSQVQARIDAIIGRCKK